MLEEKRLREIVVVIKWNDCLNISLPVLLKFEQ